MNELFETEAKNTTELVERRNSEPILASDGFISMVLSQPDGAEKIELLRELIAMKNAERERIAKEQFDAHFSTMRQELQPVVKTKLNGGTKSVYAPLEDMQAMCDPVIFKHGFSYSWREEAIENGGKRIIMDVNGYGYTKSVAWDAPSYDGNRATNPLQSAGVQSTYGQRYTYKGGFGIVTKGEDTDGETIDIDDELQKVLDNIESASTLETLMNFYKGTYEKYKQDQNKISLIIGRYNLRKQALQGGSK